MPQRTTQEAVLAICPTHFTDISGPMRLGSRMVDRVYADTVDEDTELIERYMVAGYVAQLDPRETEAASGVGNLRVKYEGRHTSGDGMNTYFQAAFQLDTTGELEKAWRASEAMILEVLGP